MTFSLIDLRLAYEDSVDVFDFAGEVAQSWNEL